MVEYASGDASMSERYWQVVLTEGEQSERSAPEPDTEVVWYGLGLAVDVPRTSDRDPYDEGGWAAALKAMEEATVLELVVVGYNRGGLLVEWNGRQGFVPVSHLADLSPYHDETEREEELRSRVGQLLCLRVIEVDR